MASVNSITFDQASYDVGAMITATVNYSPDAVTTPAPQTFTLTANLTDDSGNVVATNTAPFTVQAPAGAAESLAVSDDGNRTWSAVADPGVQGDGSLSQAWSATA